MWRAWLTNFDNFHTHITYSYLKIRTQKRGASAASYGHRYVAATTDGYRQQVCCFSVPMRGDFEKERAFIEKSICFHYQWDGARDCGRAARYEYELIDALSSVSVHSQIQRVLYTPNVLVYAPSKAVARIFHCNSIQFNSIDPKCSQNGFL